MYRIISYSHSSSAGHPELGVTLNISIHATDLAEVQRLIEALENTMLPPNPAEVAAVADAVFVGFNERLAQLDSRAARSREVMATTPARNGQPPPAPPTPPAPKVKEKEPPPDRFKKLEID